MKIILFGFLALFGWSVLSTYIYVCRIKGLCNEPITMQAGTAKHMPSALEQEEFPNDLIIYFEFDKSELDIDAGTDKFFEESNKYLDQNSQAMISITGYTDAIGSGKYNNALGYRRAKSMQQYFENKGMPANKISVKSKGEKEPIENNNSIIGRASNRRTTITVKI